MAIRRLVLVFLFAAVPATAASTSQATLARKIEQLGTHQSEGERHAIEIEACLLRKTRWTNHQDQGQVLWSVLELELADLAPPDGPDPSIAIIPWPVESAEMIVFTMRPNRLAISEVNLLRNPKLPHEPSPRDGGGKFVFREKDGFTFTFKDISPGHMAALAAALFEYRRTYCLPTS